MSLRSKRRSIELMNDRPLLGALACAAAVLFLSACEEESPTTADAATEDASDAGSDAAALDASSEENGSTGELDGGNDPSDASIHVPCEASRVEFVPNDGSLRVGAFCDEIIACVPDEEAADRLEAASDRFRCGLAESQFCSDGVTCEYVSEEHILYLDREEVEDICAITLLDPPPTRITCVRYE